MGHWRLTDIRAATSADVLRIVDMGTQFLRDSSYRDAFLENPTQMAALAHKLIASPDGDVLLLLRDETPVGMIGVIAFDHFISGQRMAGEVVYWIDRAARGRGLHLLRAAERWAVAHGAAWMQMISPDPRVDAFYARIGYAPVERIFQRAL